MSADVLTLGERRVLVCPRHVITLASEADAVTLIGDAWSHEASWVAAPVEAVHPDFFRLETRVLGGIVQKFANYGIGLAIVGDIDGWLARSQALCAFVHESRRGGTVRFVANLDALAAGA